MHLRWRLRWSRYTHFIRGKMGVWVKLPLRLELYLIIANRNAAIQYTHGNAFMRFAVRCTMQSTVFECSTNNCVNLNENWNEEKYKLSCEYISESSCSAHAELHRGAGILSAERDSMEKCMFIQASRTHTNFYVPIKVLNGWKTTSDQIEGTRAVDTNILRKIQFFGWEHFSNEFC